MDKNRARWLVLFILISLLISFILGCSVNVVESGSNAGNAKFLTGQILNESNQPVAHAEVLLKNKKDSTIASANDTPVYTDSEGKFHFPIPKLGIYFITAKKNERIVAYIDSIDIVSQQNIKLAPYKIDKSCSITGKVVVQDTSSIIQKNLKIRVTCITTHYVKELFHNDTFKFFDIPRGTYAISFAPNDIEYITKTIEVTVKPGDNVDCGDIIIKKGTTYLQESNVMTKDLTPHNNVPIDLVLSYTFTKKPMETGIMMFVKPGNQSIDIDTTIISDFSILVHPRDNLPSGKKIGVYFWVRFSDNEYCFIDFFTDLTKNFSTASDVLKIKQ